MSRDISSTGDAARALGARNAIAFDCVHPLEECMRRLSDLAVDPLGPNPPNAAGDVEFRAPRPIVRATAEAVEIEWSKARFNGRWVSNPQGTRLEGTITSHGNAMLLTTLFLLVLGFSVLGLIGGAEGTGLWFLVVPALLVVVGLPLLVSALGSARVASEIELVRLIGVAIGDPGKYAVQWRSWRED
jgi:hypothetical protein